MMGLDVSCECGAYGFRAGSYSGFHYWRVKLAKSVGIELDKMSGFGGSVIWTEDEPHYELLDHSDCEGEITAQQCEKLLEDFENHRVDFMIECGIAVDEIEALANSMLNIKSDDYDWKKYEMWREMIEHCANEGCSVHFH